METCVRGFSYMPENNLELDLQYVEGEELEGAWKATRRQRLKEQEQKIWEDFLKENDMIEKVCEDDPYQFLAHITEPQLQDLMRIEFQKIEDENNQPEIEENVETVEETPKSDVQHVTFVTDDLTDDDELFHIFDDVNDEQAVQKEEQVLESEDEGQCTVRARGPESEDGQSGEVDTVAGGSKSDDNMKNVIESSIYCAKVRDLRSKINEQLQAMITSLEVLDLNKVDPEEVKKMKKRSSEFCSRFNRIYMYQLQRQMSDIIRNKGSGAPFALHTHFQSQMARIAALHSHLLQALQIFHKSFEQTGCVLESAEMLHCLLGTVREACRTSCDVPRPKQLVSAKDLYSDNMSNYCDNLDAVLNDYTTRMSAIVNNEVSPKSKKGHRRRHIVNSKGNKSNSEAKLSMYSLDARFNMHPKKSKTNQPSVTKSGHIQNKKKDSNENTKGRRSPGSRRPLMRDACATRRRVTRENDITTMVECVDDVTCESSHISLETSPVPVNRKPARVSARRAKPNDTPRAKHKPQTQATTNVNTACCKHVQKKEDPPLSGKKGSNIEALLISALKAEEPAPPPPPPPVVEQKIEPEDEKFSDASRDGCEVTKLLKKLCGDANNNKRDRVSGTKNAQLHCINGGSPRPPTTPQLLRIIEKTIQKKSPRAYSVKGNSKERNADKFRLPLNLPEELLTGFFQYRTKFVQHMLSSSMYANSTVGKPWEMVGNISDKILDEIIQSCAKDLKISDVKQVKRNKLKDV